MTFPLSGEEYFKKIEQDISKLFTVLKSSPSFFLGIEKGILDAERSIPIPGRCNQNLWSITGNR